MWCLYGTVFCGRLGYCTVYVSSVCGLFLVHGVCLCVCGEYIHFLWHICCTCFLMCVTGVCVVYLLSGLWCSFNFFCVCIMYMCHACFVHVFPQCGL